MIFLPTPFTPNFEEVQYLLYFLLALSCTAIALCLSFHVHVTVGIDTISAGDTTCCI